MNARIIQRYGICLHEPLSAFASINFQASKIKKPRKIEAFFKLFRYNVDQSSGDDDCFYNLLVRKELLDLFAFERMFFEVFFG